MEKLKKIKNLMYENRAQLATYMAIGAVMGFRNYLAYRRGYKKGVSDTSNLMREALNIYGVLHNRNLSRELCKIVQYIKR